MLNFGTPWPNVLPDPDGSFSLTNREHLLGMLPVDSVQENPRWGTGQITTYSGPDGLGYPEKRTQKRVVMIARWGLSHLIGV